MKIVKLLSVVAGAAAITGTSPALAVPVTWNLNNVTFTDGGTATGSFTFDDAANAVSTFSIMVAGGNTDTFPAVTYDNSDAGAFLFNAATFGFSLNDSTREIRFVTDAALTSAGGSVNLTSGGLAAECYNCSPYRLYASGTLQAGAVPEPATWAMMLLGFAGVGFTVRSRRRNGVHALIA